MDIVYTKDASSGRIHKRIRVDNRLVPYGGEEDNLDDAGAYSEIPEAEAFAAPAADKCDRCFPVEAGTPDTEPDLG